MSIIRRLFSGMELRSAGQGGGFAARHSMYVRARISFPVAECPAEMGERRNYLESPGDSDRREQSGDFHEDETDYQEWRNVEEDKAPWTLARCESLLSSSESDHEDQDPDITDPLLAHES